MSRKRDELFGLLALEARLINESQLAQAVAESQRIADGSLADVLTAHGLISREARATLESRLPGWDSSLAEPAPTARLGLADTDPLSVSAGPALDDTEPAGEAFGSNGGAATSAWGPREQRVLGHLASPPGSESRYQPVRFHARGGIGQIWVARDCHLGREVAVKELRADRERDSLTTARFLEEARITCQLEHPGIVPVYDLAESSGQRQPFYTMRFVKGRTLSEAIEEFHSGGRARSAADLQFRSLVSALVAVCNTVAYAHSRGVIHRDLKPQNVVLGNYGEVILLDWGLAKLVLPPQNKANAEPPPPPVVLDFLAEREETQRGEAVGTLAYMAPESASEAHGEVTQTTDIYGLGAILYEILTGRAPFRAANSRELLKQVRDSEPQRPGEAAPGAPPALEAICLQAIARRQADRYVSATAMAEDLLRWLADQSVSAYPDPIHIKLGRWARRQKAVVSGVAALLITVVVALAVTTLLLDRKRQEVERAQDRSEASFRLALNAINDLLVQFSDERLSQVPEMLPVRREVADQALRVYQSLLAMRVFEPRMFLETAHVYRQIGELQALTHDYARARVTYELGLELLKRVMNEFPNDEAAQTEWIELTRALAELNRWQGRNRDAELLLRRGVEAAERLVERFPQTAEYRRLLARLHFFQADLLRSTGHFAEALAEYEMAREFWQPQQKGSIADTTEATEQTLLLAGQADVVYRLGDLARAEGLADAAIDAGRTQLRLRPRSVSSPYALGEALRQSAEIIADTRPNVARDRLDEALGLLSDVASRVPSVQFYAAKAAETQLGRGQLRLTARDLAGARVDVNQARTRLEAAVREHSDLTEVIGLLGRSLLLSAQLALDEGNTAEARGLVNQAEAQLTRALAASPDSYAVKHDLTALAVARRRMESE